MPENMSQSDSDTGRGAGWVMAQGVIFLIFLIAVVFGDSVQDVAGLIFAQIVGLIVAVSGAAVSVWALRQHGWQMTPFPKPPDGAHLIESGLYG